MWKLPPDYQSCRLSQQQPSHRTLLWFWYFPAVAVLLDFWPFPEKLWPCHAVWSYEVPGYFPCWKRHHWHILYQTWFTPVSVNTSHNTPKSFLSSKFKPNNQSEVDIDCKPDVHTTSNQPNEKKYEFYWGYKNHILVDCISSLPICELTTTAEVADSSVALDILSDTHTFFPITECTFLTDKGYDVKNIYNQAKELYNGECIIPLNKQNTKNPKLLPHGNPICDGGFAMWKDGKFSDKERTHQKFCCPLKNSKQEEYPCRHKNFYNGRKHRGCTKYISLSDDLQLSIDRNNRYSKISYFLHTECECYNSRFKNTGQGTNAGKE